MAEVVRHLRAELPADAIVCNGAGNYNGWVNRFFPYRGFRTQLAPVSGSMGYGLPAAIAAKLVHPGREVVAFAGDGCFLMTGQELATAVQYELPLVVLVVNNGMYGTIRMHQEREHPARVIGTACATPTSPPTPAPSAPGAGAPPPPPSSATPSPRPGPSPGRR
jgi:acetolactate synthase-1/2/3 large subunit